MQITSGALKGLRFAGALLLLSGVAALGLLYWKSVDQKERYLNGRNFRLLTILATQTQNMVDAQGRILQGTVRDETHWKAGETWAAWRSIAAPLVLTLQSAVIDHPESRIPFDRSAIPQYTFVTRSGVPTLTIAVTSDASPDTPLVTSRTPVAALLEPIFAPKLRQGAFDTLVFASQEGHVYFATGRRRLELQSTQLDSVLAGGTEVTKKAPAPAGNGAAAESQAFREHARTISVRDVVIAGVDYKMFVHPCCRTFPSTKDSGADDSHEGMVVAGFTESDVLRADALAVSPTFIVAGVIVTLVGFVGWPFFKLALLGERQRVSVWDVVRLGACSVFGLALVTTIAFTIAASARLNADLDIQLEHFAQSINQHLSQQIASSYQRLTAMANGMRRCAPGSYPNVVDAYSCQPATAIAGDARADYDAFSLLNADGFQALKAAPTRWVPSRINVRGRQYFDIVSTKQPSPTPECPEGCVLESVWSWTTGLRQAVLSKPVQARDSAYTVAALATSMPSLIDPAKPPGYEFAVVDASGAVLFHSDSQRNVQEDLFQESDNNRRLRAMVAGHIAGPLSIAYWGRPYRAYVLPTGRADWSIVTLFDKEATRGLILEWTMFSIVLLTVYTMVWVAVMIVGLKIGASWLWPDPLRQRAYVALAVGYVVLLTVFALVFVTSGSATIFWAGLALPVVAWLMTFMALNRRPAAASGRLAMNPISAYRLAATLFLVVTGIVPGIAVHARSYDLHIESYVKQRQLEIAKMLNSRGARTNDAADLGVYFDFFNHTELIHGEPLKNNPPGNQPHHDLALSLLEEYLPYFDELSVERRELMHERAADRAWISNRIDRRLDLTLALNGPAAQPIVVRSTLPSLLYGTNEVAESVHIPPLTAAALPSLLIGVMVLAYATVAFMLRHVFLSHVTEPLWASARLVTTSGESLLVICDPATMAARIKDATVLELGSIRRDPQPAAAWRRTLMKINSEETGRAIVVTDIDSDLEDLDSTYHKLELLEELVNDAARTVVVLSKNPPALLADSARRTQRSSTRDKERWTKMWRAFVVFDGRDAPEAPIQVKVEPSRATGWRRWVPRFPSLRNSQSSTSREALLSEEGRPDKYLSRICDDIRNSDAFKSGLLTYEQILDEIDERASGYYRRLWASCLDDEKVVLGQVAQVGLTNAASRRTVRRLLVRRLLTKDPDLRLMNQTFRMFVLSPANRATVARLEGMAEPSTWDRLRLPFVMATAAAGVFLYATQRDVFNSTAAIVAGVTTAVPTVVRLVSMLAQRQTPTPDAGGPSSNV